MMTAPTPPNGPRMPQYRHQQIDALTQMFGEPETLPATCAPASPLSALLDGVELRAIRVIDGPTFIPTPGTLDDTREPGRLFWMGAA